MFFSFKSSILGLTYIAYTCYHMTRKPIAVLKPELLNCSNNTHNETTDCGYAPFGEKKKKKKETYTHKQFDLKRDYTIQIVTVIQNY